MGGGIAGISRGATISTLNIGAAMLYGPGYVIAKKPINIRWDNMEAAMYRLRFNFVYLYSTLFLILGGTDSK